MNAAAQILLKQLAHIESQENDIQLKIKDTETALRNLYKDLELVKDASGEIRLALDILSKGVKEDVKRPKSKKTK